MPDPAHVIQSQPSEETMELIDLVAADAVEVLGVSLEDSPQSIIAAVNDCVRDLQKGAGPELNEDEDIVMNRHGGSDQDGAECSRQCLRPGSHQPCP